MKKLIASLASFAMCSMFMLAPAFASEPVTEPVLPSDTVSSETITPRAGTTVTGQVSRGSVIYYYSSKINVTCVFDISYNSASGYIYSISLNKIYSDSSYVITGRIVEKKKINDSTYDVKVSLDLKNSSGGFVASRDIQVRI